MLGKRKFLLVLAALALIAAQASFSQAKVTVTVYGDQGQNLQPVEWLKADAAAKGINIEIVGVPFTSVYEKLKTEFVGGTGAYDVVIFYPAYLGEFAEFGYLQPLDPLFSGHDPKMEDVVPAYRDLYDMYNGKTYALPYDGDILNLYYVQDIFTNSAEKAAFKAKYGKELAVPKTWDDLYNVAQFFTRKKGEKLAGKTLDQDYYGFAFLGARGFAYAWWGNIFGSMGGAYFDRNMKPQINAKAGIDALTFQKKLMAFCPPDVMNFGYEELKNAYLQGRVAMMVQWSDVWKKANDPKLSKIVHNAGIAQMPGVKQPDGSIYYPRGSSRGPHHRDPDDHEASEGGLLGRLHAESRLRSAERHLERHGRGSLPHLPDRESQGIRKVRQHRRGEELPDGGEGQSQPHLPRHQHPRLRRVPRRPGRGGDQRAVRHRGRHRAP